MNRLRVALTLLIFMISLVAAPLVEALPIRVRTRPPRVSTGAPHHSTFQARDSRGRFTGGYRPGYGPNGPTSTALAVRPRGDVATRPGAGGNGGGTTTALTRTGDAGGGALVTRDTGLPARADAPGAGRADFSGDMPGWTRVDPPEGVGGVSHSFRRADGTEIHILNGEGRFVRRRPGGDFELINPHNPSQFARDLTTGRRPGQVLDDLANPNNAAITSRGADVAPIGGRGRTGADAPTTPVRDVDASPTTRASADAPARVGTDATPTVANRRGRFRRIGNGLLIGVLGVSGGYALRNTMGDPANNTPGSIDNTPGFGQGTGPGGTAGSGNGTGTGVTNTGGDTTLGSGNLYGGNNGSGNGNGGAPGVTTGGNGGPTGITTGDPRDRVTGDQDQDGFAVGSLNRPPTQRLDFNFEN